MSVLIKGLKMPKNCTVCPFKGFDRAKGKGNICTIDETITLHAVLDGLDVKFVNIGDCPLVPIPDHGDLIDRDEAADDACLIWGRNSSGDDAAQEIIEHLRKMKAVIPAERSEDV